MRAQQAAQARQARVAILRCVALAAVLGTGHPGGDVGVLVDRLNFDGHVIETRTGIGSNRKCHYPNRITESRTLGAGPRPPARRWPETPPTGTEGARWRSRC